MLAALLLERKHNSLFDLPEVSMMRNKSIGPHNLLLLSKETVSSLPYLSSIGFVAVILSTTTLALQFTSTALLTDFGTGTVVGNEESLSIPIAKTLIETAELSLNWSAIDERGINYWQSRPLGYPTFGEYSETPYTTVNNSVADTGATIRAFLPYAKSSDRMSVRNYSGPATVVNTRFTCVRPDDTGFIAKKRVDTVYIDGTIFWNQTSPSLPMLSIKDVEIDFSCVIPLSTEQHNSTLVSSEWFMSICDIKPSREYQNHTEMISDLSKSVNRNSSGGEMYILGIRPAHLLTGMKHLQLTQLLISQR